MTKPSNMPVGVDRIWELMDELLASWSEEDGQELNIRVGKGKQLKNRRVSEFLVIFGLAAHVHRLGAAVLQLTRAGMFLEAVPLVRQAFECGITAQWIALVNDAMPAMTNEEIRRRRTLLATARKAGHSGLDDAPGLDVSFIQELETSAAGARSFAALCEDLDPGGAQLYTTYRVLSSWSHASLKVVDQYLEERDGGGLPRLLYRSDVRSINEHSWLSLMLWAMLLAGRAVDLRHVQHRRRSHLRAVAGEVQLPVEFRLSGAAWRRGAVSKRRR